MLLAAAIVFIYYTTWALLLVRPIYQWSTIIQLTSHLLALLRLIQPHTRLFPGTRVGRALASFHSGCRPGSNRLVRGIDDSKRKSQKGTESTAANRLMAVR